MIGEQLKLVRKSQCLTQEQMADNVVNRSFYSRVEHGSSAITVNDLMNILYKHEISMVAFLKDFGDVKPKVEVLQDQITLAYANKDVVSLEKMFDQLEFEDLKTEKLLQFLIDDLNGEATRSQFKQLSHFLLKSKVWNENILWMLSHIMDWYKIDDLRTLVKVIPKKINYPRINARTKIIMARIVVNYLDICNRQNEFDSEDEEAIEFLKSLPNSSDMRMYKLLAVYYEKLFYKQYGEAENIANLIEDIAYL
ncbi:helix-turn-helix transcriptional regulator [uncultured Lactobacillus sp.]|uniref:helix-turn-helix domain-containing protein n=1 Tax=uncultured Lactobacillus sp. TaxID=153152 RepID=UPI002803FDD8|nr:helix-turn-helix transcriptional regulator [uncultured Lactobacillus sp.]